MNTRKILDHSIGCLINKADIDFLPEELNRFMDAAPLMIGREYLDRTLLAGVWKKLNQFFSREIKIFTGSVKDFFHGFSPHIHLAGRVYFHLVESKDDAFPFQFLATYATQSENSQKHRPLDYALEEAQELLAQTSGLARIKNR